MSEQDNIALVQRMYAAFGAGDMDTLFGGVDDAIIWTDHGPGDKIPVFGVKRGKEGLTRFFTQLAELTDVEMFEPRDFVAQGDKVVALGRYRFHVKATGKAYECDWAMVFRIRDGKVYQFDEHTDSALIVEAFTP